MSITIFQVQNGLAVYNRSLWFVRLEQHVKSFSRASSSLSTISSQEKGCRRHQHAGFLTVLRGRWGSKFSTLHCNNSWFGTNKWGIPRWVLYTLLSSFLFCFAIVFFKIAHCSWCDARIMLRFYCGWRSEMFYCQQ